MFALHVSPKREVMTMMAFFTSDWVRPDKIRFATRSNGDATFTLAVFQGDHRMVNLCGIDRQGMEALYASIGAALQDSDETARELENAGSVYDGLPIELTRPDSGNPVG